MSPPTRAPGPQCNGGTPEDSPEEGERTGHPGDSELGRAQAANPVDAVSQMAQ